MYPYGDVPVLQLSLPTHDPDRLLAIGSRLRPLREQGVLVIGSGYLTHGLPFLSRTNFEQNTVPGWSADFDGWAKEALAAGAVDALADFHRAPGMPYAHPTVEHFTPIFVTLGAADRSRSRPDHGDRGLPDGPGQAVLPGQLTRAFRARYAAALARSPQPAIPHHRRR